jgi:hypothetical protein
MTLTELQSKISELRNNCSWTESPTRNIYVEGYRDGLLAAVTFIDDLIVKKNHSFILSKPDERIVR